MCAQFVAWQRASSPFCTIYGIRYEYRKLYFPEWMQRLIHLTGQDPPLPRCIAWSKALEALAQYDAERATKASNEKRQLEAAARRRAALDRATLYHPKSVVVQLTGRSNEEQGNCLG